MTKTTPRGECSPLTSSSYDRWEILQLVKDTRSHLGIGEREITVLAAHLSVLPKGRIDQRAPNFSFMKVGSLLERASCMKEKTFNLAERKLEACGIVSRRLSANGRRFAMRNSAGKITDAYGIDLAPLLMMIPHLQEVRSRIMEEAQRMRDRRTRLSCRLASLKRRVDDGCRNHLQDLEELSRAVRNALRRKTAGEQELTELDRKISAAETALEDRLANASTEDPSNDKSKMPPKEDGSLPRTRISDRSAPTKMTADAGHIDRHIESQQKEKIEGPTYDHRCTIRAWRASQEVASLFPDEPSNQRQALAAILDFSRFMGLGQDVSARALAIFGCGRITIILDEMARKLATGKLKSPKAYLESLIQSASRGEAVLAARMRAANV